MDMTTKEMIAVMQGHEDGKPIQFRRKDTLNWVDFNGSPAWSWISHEYRIAPHRPDSINWEEVADGYDFMARDGNGRAWLYKNRPIVCQIAHECWTDDECDTYTSSANAFKSYRNGGVDWRESLVTRHQAKGE